MGWNFTLAPYDATVRSEISKVAQGANAARDVRDRLAEAVPRDARSPNDVQVLEEAEDLRVWLQVLVAETALTAPGVFLGRSSVMADYLAAAERRYGHAGRALIEALEDLARLDEELSPYPEDMEGVVLAASPAAVARAADAIASLDPTVVAMGHVATSERMSGITANRRRAFHDEALPCFLGVVRHAAERGWGLLASHDELSRLRREDPWDEGELRALDETELELQVDESLTLPASAPEPVKPHGALRLVARISLLVLAPIVLAAWLIAFLIVPVAVASRFDGPMGVVLALVCLFILGGVGAALLLFGLKLNDSLRTAGPARHQ